LAGSSVKWGAIDLNLLVVFDAVMQERSVTRAGSRLGLSQLAMSHALTRLRHTLKDELFVRSPKGMVPTPRAEGLALPVRAALEGLQHSLEPTGFDPLSATRTFSVAVDNYAAVVLVGPIAVRITKSAPQLSLAFRPSGTLNLLELLDGGALDLAIGTFGKQGERFSTQPLLQDGFVAVLRKGHPAMGKRALSIETFAALPHLEISSAHHATDFIDEALARKKLKRRIALRAPFLSAVGILVTSDMVSILPRRIAEELVRNRPLVMHPLSPASPSIETAMLWPRRLADQPAHRWLRDMVCQATKGLRADTP
jgi:DNA-binding transcriptional LysR family regulator